MTFGDDGFPLLREHNYSGQWQPGYLVSNYLAYTHTWAGAVNKPNLLDDSQFHETRDQVRGLK